MRQPPGFNHGERVLKLNKSLYGLKQAANVWNKTLDNCLKDMNFKSSEIDKCLYKKHIQDKVCYILIHVDDMLFASNSLKMIENINKKFEIKCLGDVSNYLGIEIERDDKGHFLLSQSRYIDETVAKFELKDAKTSKFPISEGYYKHLDESKLESNEEYRKIIGKLLYHSKTRPDIVACVKF